MNKEYTNLEFQEISRKYRQVIRQFFGRENEPANFYISSAEIHGFNEVLWRGENVTAIGGTIPWYSNTKNRVSHEVFMQRLDDLSQKTREETEAAERRGHPIVRCIMQ